MGKVYLICFDEPLHHARHYVGYTDNLEQRMEQHLSGNGSKLLRAVVEAGITYSVVQVWDGDRKFERSIKNKKNTPKICPRCSAKRRTS